MPRRTPRISKVIAGYKSIQLVDRVCEREACGLALVACGLRHGAS